MKKLKLTNLIISSGLILTLSIGLIAYNSNKEANSDTATSTSENNTSNNNSTSEEPTQITETQVNSPEVVQSEQTNAPATASTNQTTNVANRNNSKQTTTNTSNTNTDNSNTSTSNSTDIEKTEPSINTDTSNNSTSPTPEQKPETNKPVTNTPITPPNNDNNNTTTPSASFIAEIEQAIFQQVNAEREKAGVPTLSYNNTMQKYARIKSQDMGDRNYFAHENPEGQLITVQMQKDGVSYQAWGENIAYIQSSSSNSSLASQFMTNWMNSSGHRANILSTNFSSIGIGVYKVGNTYYATQEFYR